MAFFFLFNTGASALNVAELILLPQLAKYLGQEGHTIVASCGHLFAIFKLFDVLSHVCELSTSFGHAPELKYAFS